MDRLEQTQNQAQLDLDKAKKDQAGVNGGDSQSRGEQKNQGVTMVASPIENSDKTVNLYDDPENKTGNQKFTDAPFTVKADPNDVKKSFIKILSIPKHPEAKPGYAYKSSIRNTDAAFKALDYFNITGEERNVFLANADHESGGGTALVESTKYSTALYWGGGSGLVKDKNGNNVEKSYDGINNQTRAITKGYFEKYAKESGQTDATKRRNYANEKFQALFSTWTSEKIGNYMYGIEGAELAESLNQKPSGDWIYKGMDNVNKGDGYKYRGRTSVQITGRNAYQTLHNKLNEKAETGSDVTVYEKVTGKKGPIDVIGNPDLLVQDEFLSYFASAEFWDRVSRRRIKNTLKNNNLGDKNSLNSLTDSKQAVLIGRKSIAGESTNLSKKPIGLADTQEKYDKNHAVYDEAYAEYSAGKTSNGGSGSELAGQSTEKPQVPEPPADPVVEYPDIDVAAAISYNTKHNPGMLEYLQTYLGIAKTNEFDETTVKTIAKWQKDTNGVLKVDGKFGDKSYEYALKHGLKELMPTMLDEVVITGKKGGSSANDGGGSAGGDADRGVEEKPKEEKPKEVKPDEPDPAGLYTGTELIGKNSSNRSAVKTIQYYLKKYGFEHGAEGKMDHKTFLNVMYYQFTRNLSSVDGEVGTTSWGAFRNDPGKVYEMDDTIGYSGGKSKKITLAPIKDANNKEWKIADKAVESFNNLHNKYKSTHSGKGLAITSTYRAMTSAGTKASKSGGNSGQIELYANYKYGIGGQALAAKPGTSNHQSGIAIDFAMDTVKVNGKKVKDANGRYKIQDSSKPLERWLIDNGPDDKFYNIKSEPWHYDYKG